ncbi:putative mfs [Phaeomoniella chlamydospora]|uniref:Putative mfs n=1 Tax=Phaeomoniella chlamydospora TaxID=158046 RepID=A0A0G2DVV8_PHACM|nr:putative mfs [Phaeomoniella chlamydospora]
MPVHHPATAAPAQYELQSFDQPEEAPDTVSEPEPRSNFRIFAILGALFISIFLVALDQTIISTSIATISADFGSASGYTWVASAYLLAFAAGGPVWASLSNIWGRKVVLLAAVVWFAASSIICATAKSMAILIMGRALQGVAGGALLLLVNICISDLFSMRKRGFYLGLTEVVWTAASGFGPILGGLWEGIKAIDWFGSITILGLTIMVLLGLDFGGETFPWGSARVICLIVFGLLFALFFLFSEAKLARYPLMPLSIMRHRSNIASLLVDFCHGVSFIAAEYYLPLYMQSVRGASPIHSGLLVLPIGLTTSLTGIVCGIIMHQTGRYREIIWIGTVIFTLGFGLFIDLSATSKLSMVILFQIVIGIGSGMLFQAPLIALQSLVSQEDTATATATFEFIRNLATSLSIVIGGVVFQNSMQLQSHHLSSSGLSQNLTEALSGKEAAANVVLIHQISDPTQKAVVKEAFAWSMRNMWILYCCVAACAIVASGFISKQKLNKEHTETRTGLRKEKDQTPCSGSNG